MEYRTPARLALAVALSLAMACGHFGWQPGWLIVPGLVAAGMSLLRWTGPRTIEILENRTMFPSHQTAYFLFVMHAMLMAVGIAIAYGAGLALR